MLRRKLSVGYSISTMVEVTEKDIFEVLEKLSIEGYKSHEIFTLSDKPIGFLADHFILRVFLDSTPVTKEFFLKAVPRNVEKRVEYLDETGFFKKEVQIYQNLIPRLLKSSSISWSPECYLAKDGHFIIMEILQDFKVKSVSNLTFDFEHLKVAAETLAVFHASSLVLQEKTGCDFVQDYGEMLEENSYPSIEGHVRQKGLENGTKVLMELVKLIPKYENSPKLERILEKFPETFKTIYEFSKPSKKYKNVVSHGDLWVNNLMFKYDDGTPVECKFIDYQLARFAPPAFDLAALIYINSTNKLRNSRLDDILNIYLNTFEKELLKNHLDPSILPKSEILESFKEFHLIGLIEAGLFGHLTMLPANLSTSILSSSEEYDKFINQSRVETCMKAFKEDYYRDRITEILTEIIETFIMPKIE